MWNNYFDGEENDFGFEHPPREDFDREFDHGPRRGRGPGGPGGHGPGGRGPGGRGPGGRPGPDWERGPHGRPPMPDADALRARVAEADLDELMLLGGRLMPRGHGGAGRGQSLVLSILAGRETLSQRALQQMLGVQPGSLSELAGKLERKGYIVRERGDDKRGNLLRITEEGRKAIPAEEERQDPFAILDDAQRETLATLLRTLINSWIE